MEGEEKGKAKKQSNRKETLPPNNFSHSGLEVKKINAGRPVIALPSSPFCFQVNTPFIR